MIWRMRHRRSPIGLAHISGFVAIGLTAIMASGLAAHARPSTQSYSCAGVRALIAERGPITLSTKAPHIYRKFYAPEHLCPFDTEHKTITVPTRDGSCRLYICRRPLKPMFEDRFKSLF